MPMGAGGGIHRPVAELLSPTFQPGTCRGAAAATAATRYNVSQRTCQEPAWLRSRRHNAGADSNPALELV
jgi:hypothetical protein